MKHLFTVTALVLALGAIVALSICQDVRAPHFPSQIVSVPTSVPKAAFIGHFKGNVFVDINSNGSEPRSFLDITIDKNGNATGIYSEAPSGTSKIILGRIDGHGNFNMSIHQNDTKPTFWTGTVRSAKGTDGILVTQGNFREIVGGELIANGDFNIKKQPN